MTVWVLKQFLLAAVREQINLVQVITLQLRKLVSLRIRMLLAQMMKYLTHVNTLQFG